MAGDDDSTKTPIASPAELGGADDDESGDLKPGFMAGEYVIERTIASGGFGSVYAARHRLLGRAAAVKVLHAQFVDSKEMVDRFVQEARAVNLVSHPNIVDIYELGLLPDGRPYMIMELLDGTTLKEYLKALGRQSPSDALAILRPVCAALHAAHSHGIIHRDIKASNIAVNADLTRVKLLDFGIAKLLRPEPGTGGLTTAQRRLGSPSAMAPEQILGLPVDARTDIYALGILSYALLTARLPFEGYSGAEIERQHLEAPPPRVSDRVPVSPAIDAVVLRCLEKTPDKRFASVLEFLDAFAAAVPKEGAVDNDGERAIRTGIGIHVGIHVRDDVAGGDQIDDEVFGAMADALEIADQALRGGGFQVCLQTSTEMVGVRVFPEQGDAMRTVADAARRTAHALETALSAKVAAQPRLRVTVAIHVDDIVVQREGTEVVVVDGPLLRVEEWVRPPEADVTLTLSPKAEARLKLG